MKEQHIVPLAGQVVELLRRLHEINGSGSSPYLFPGLGTSERPISENTLNAVLRKIGYSKTEMTAQDFRRIDVVGANTRRQRPPQRALILEHMTPW